MSGVRVNFSVWTAGRKWPCRSTARGRGLVAGIFVCVIGVGVTSAEARAARGGAGQPFGGLFQDFGAPRRAAKPKSLASVPLPKPRPAEAPTAAAEPMKPVETAKPAPPDKPVAEQKPQEPAAPPQPSACRMALTDQIAVAPSLPDITGPGACGGTDLVRLEAVLIPGKGRVPLKPAATLRCEMATAIAGWVREDMAPLAASLGTSLAELDNFDSFDCRGRNRVAGAKISEHGRANALDLRSLKFTNGQSVSLTDRAAGRDIREKVLQSVCARFTTVLGPGSDGYHEDHIHIDIAARRGGYRICQWDIYEPMPPVAPLMPAERPADAPPRAVAEGKPASAPASSQPSQPNAEEAAPEPVPPPKPARTKTQRRSSRD